MHRALIAGVTILALAGCGTVAGFGRDVTSVGNALTSASNDAAKPTPAKRQVAAKKATPTKVAAKSTTAKPAAAKTSAAKKSTVTRVAAKSPAKKTTSKTVAAAPAPVEVVETGKPFKPGK